MSNLWSAIEFAPVSRYSSVAAFLDGNNDVIDTGVQAWVRVPFDGEIDKVSLLADQPGSIVVDIWKDVFANYPPTNADSITGGNEPELSSDDEMEDSTLTGWTTAVAEDDILYFHVDSATTIEKLLVTLRIART